MTLMFFMILFVVVLLGLVAGGAGGLGVLWAVFVLSLLAGAVIWKYKRLPKAPRKRRHDEDDPWLYYH